MLLKGKNDVLVNYKDTKIISDVCGGTFTLYQDGGHGVNDQYCQSVNASLEINILSGIEKKKIIAKNHNRHRSKL